MSLDGKFLNGGLRWKKCKNLLQIGTYASNGVGIQLPLWRHMEGRQAALIATLR